MTAVSKDGQSAAATIGYSVSQASTSLTAAPQEVLYPPPTGIGLGKVSATLTSNGTNLASETITFSVPATSTSPAQTLCTATTNAQGTASCKLTTAQENEVLYAGSYDASFAGDANHLASSATTPFIVQDTEQRPARASTRPGTKRSLVARSRETAWSTPPSWSPIDSTDSRSWRSEHDGGSTPGDTR